MIRPCGMGGLSCGLLFMGTYGNDGCKEYSRRDTACRKRRLKVARSQLPIRVGRPPGSEVLRWANIPLCKKDTLRKHG